MRHSNDVVLRDFYLRDSKPASRSTSQPVRNDADPPAVHPWVSRSERPVTGLIKMS